METCDVLKALDVRRLHESLEKLEGVKGETDIDLIKKALELATNELKRVLAAAAQLDEEDRRQKKLEDHFRKVRELGPIEK